MTDVYDTWEELAMIRTMECGKLEAKSAERLAVIESLLAVIAWGEITGNAIISDELAARIRSAREE